LKSTLELLDKHLGHLACQKAFHPLSFSLLDGLRGYRVALTNASEVIADVNTFFKNLITDAKTIQENKRVSQRK